MSVGGPVGRPVGRTQVAGDRCRASRRPERSSLAALDGWHRQSAAAGSWVHLRLLGKGRHENGRGCGIWTAITLLGRAIRPSRGRFFSSSLCCARRALDGTLCWVWPSAWTLSSLHLSLRSPSFMDSRAQGSPAIGRQLVLNFVPGGILVGCAHGQQVEGREFCFRADSAAAGGVWTVLRLSPLPMLLQAAPTTRVLCR